MKIQVSQQELLRAAMIAAIPASHISTVPILANVLIEATESGVELRAGAFDLRARVPMQATVIEPGVVTVPAKTLADLVKSLPGEQITLEETGEAVTIFAGSSKTKLATMPARDFPSWPSIPATTILTIQPDVLRDIVGRVLPAAAPAKDPRPTLTGVCITINADGLTAVATDGKVLGKLITQCETGVKTELQLIVPVFLLTQVEKLLRDNPVTFSTDELQVAIDVDGVRFIANAISGRYPDTDRVIPKEFSLNIEFPRNPMLTTIKRAAIMASRENGCMDLDFSPGSCRVTSEDFDRGQYTDMVEAKIDTEFSTCVSFKLFGQALSAINSDIVYMSANTPTRQLIFKGEKEGFMMLVMPIKKAEVYQEPEPVREAAPV